MLGNRNLRRIGFAAVLALGVWLPGASARAQLRNFARVIANPAETTTPLIFDINNDSTDNISPNIVLSKDAQSAYVAYAGSGDIIRFSLTTGEILDRIRIDGTPCFAMQLPNDRLAFVSIFKDKTKSLQDDRIFILDMNSNAIVATWSFVNAQFGFGSVPALSPDGATGYISSTGTAEVIKFSAVDGHEIGRFTGPSDPKQKMRFPTQITVSPDGATLFIVDTDPGTPELALYDSTTFTKKGSLKNPDPTNQAVAFTIFNRAVLAPDGKTGIIASRGQNNVQYTDLVFLFDATNGTILKTGATGPGPQWTGLTPDGKNWVIVNMFSLTVIPTDNFDNKIEHQAPAGESLGSANVVFSPDSKFAYYAAAGTSSLIRDLVLQVDLETGSYLERIQVGDNPDMLEDQPSSMAITPDGKTVVALEFISDNIDLMTQITLTAGAKFLCSPDFFTGISLLNLSTQTNKLTLYAMQDFGEMNQETGVNNPVIITLEPNQQISKTVSEIFNFDDANAPNGERTGWLAIYSEQPEITGYVTIGKKDFTSLNGLPLDRVSERLHDWVLPVIDRNGDASVQLSTLNPTLYTADYNVTRVGKNGIIIDSQPGRGASASSRVQEDLADLFPRDNLDLEGYMWLTSFAGVFGNELFNNGKSFEIIKGIDRYPHVGVNKLYGPQWATVTGWKTILNLINTNTAEADVTVTFHAADATILWQFQKHFVIGEQIRGDVTTWFNTPPADFTILISDPSFLSSAGWLEVESTQDQILGTVTFNATDDHFTAGYELNGAPLTQFMFPIVTQNEIDQTGVALLNVTPDPANVAMELWGMDGNLIATASMTLAPLSRNAVYLDSLFPGMDPLLMGNLRIRSDKALCGFALVNDAAYTFVMAMPATAK